MKGKYNKNIVWCCAPTILVLISSCDEEVTTSPIETVPPQRFIFVDSKPQNYKIYLDGQFTGRYTPDSLPFVKETIHEITLKKNYWNDTTLSVEAQEGELATLDVNYLVNPNMFGSVKFTSDPEKAEISIDDSLLNARTPYVLRNILPGYIKLNIPV